VTHGTVGLVGGVRAPPGRALFPSGRARRGAHGSAGRAPDRGL